LAGKATAREGTYHVSVSEEMSFGRDMSGTEAMMWNIERDPWLASTAGAVAFYDRPLDFARFRLAIASAVATTVRLRQHVLPGHGPLAPPHWGTDRDFDLDWHVRRIGAPGEGSVRDLLDWVTQFFQDPFDRTRPLWQYVVIDGLAEGRGALVSKLHHTVTDGQGAVRLASAYTTIKRRAPKPIAVDLEALIRAAPEHQEGVAGEATDLVSGAIRWPIDLIRKIVDLAMHPERLVRTSVEAAGLVRTTTDQLHPAGSVLWRNRSRRRHLEALSVPFEAAHHSAKTLGGTLNDFFMTGAAEAAHRYHRQLASSPERFHVTFVVSTRTDDSSGENAFTPVPVELPGGAMDLVERFNSIHRLLGQRRREVHGSGPMGVVATVANLVPTSVVTSLIRSQASHIDFATSNLPVFLGDTYVAGARTLHAYAFGPLAGTAFNLTLMSIAGSLDIGAHLDPAAVTEPELLRVSLEDAYRDLIALA
jgi:WS/DGAT/MGAT family acyltransferase